MGRHWHQGDAPAGAQTGPGNGVHLCTPFHGTEWGYPVADRL